MLSNLTYASKQDSASDQERRQRDTDLDEELLADEPKVRRRRRTGTQLRPSQLSAVQQTSAQRVPKRLTTVASVEKQISVIKTMLSKPLDGPHDAPDELRDFVNQLLWSIAEAPNDLTIDQKRELDQLEVWQHPFYTINFAQE